MQQKAIKYNYFFLLMIVLLAYAPVSGFLFALKNDAFTGYFPPKLFFGEGLQQGFIPLWNPFVNYGFPIYGDMSMAWWNPLTWLVGGLGGYNVYSFTVEELFYIVLASGSFYTLTGYWKWHQTAKINAALSYACSGYFIGHLQHFNWLSGMAFFPLVMFFYLKIVERASIRNFAGMALSTFFFFTSAHPGLSIGGFYFLLFFMVPDLFRHIKNGNRSLIHYSSVHVLLFIVLMMTLAGPLYAYLEVIPHITRGSKLDGANTLANPTTIQSWISLALPFATVKGDRFFLTDIAMRNCYTGLITLIFFLSAFRKKMWSNHGQWIAVLVFFVLLSAGGIFGEYSNRFLPLIGYVRLSGEFTIFALFAIIIIAGKEFNRAIEFSSNVTQIKAIWWLAGLIVLTVIIAIFNIAFTHNSILFDLSDGGKNLKNTLKWIVDHLTIADTIIIQGIIQLIILYLINTISVKKNSYFKWLIAIDMVAASLLNIPFTGVGKMSPAEVQQLIDGAKTNALIIPQRSDSAYISKIIGDVHWYNRIPGNKELISYPMVLTAAANYFQSPNKNTNDRKPFAFVDSGHVNNLKYAENKITFDIYTPVSSIVTVQQINYPGWKINSNTGPVSPLRHQDELISFETSPSATSVEITFENSIIKILVYYSGAILCVLCLLFFLPGKNSKTISASGTSSHNLP
jgi:hypothetical protein